MAELFKRRDSRFWWARIKNADPPRQSTGVEHTGRTKRETRELEKEAQRWADECEASIRAQGAPLSVERVVEEAGREQEYRKRKDSTRDRGRVSGAHLGTHLGWDTNVKAVKPAAFVEDYVRVRRAAGVTDHTIAKEWNWFLMGLRRCKRDELFDGNVDAFKSAALHGVYDPRTRWLPVEELRLLLEAEHKASEAYTWAVSRRDWILGFYFTGARHGELHRIRRQDVDLDRRELLVRGTKTKRSTRTVPIFDDLAPVLERRLDLGHEYLFRPEWQRGRANANLKTWCASAGIERCSPNDFRRSFATMCAERGIDEALTTKFLGHTSSRMVREVYGQVSERMRARARRQFGSVLETCSDGSTPIEKAWDYRGLTKSENG